MTCNKTVVQMCDFVPHARRSFEQYLVGLAEHLRERGWRTVHVVAGEPGDFFREQLVRLDSPFHITKFQPSVRSAFSLGRFLRQYRPTVLHTHFMSKFSLAIPVLKRMMGARHLIISDQSSGFANRKSRVGKLLTRLRGVFSGSYVDYLVAVSDFVCRRDVDEMHFPVGKVQVIHNGVDVDQYRPSTSQKDSETTIAFAGRLDPGKGVMTLLKAVSALSSRGETAFKLMIAGRGSQEAELRQYCAANKLDSRVTFLGHIDWLSRLFSEASVVVIPSNYGEAFGYVVAEAMACGGCVLVSDDGAIPEVVGPGGESGWIFRAGDPADLATKLSMLLKDSAKRTEMSTAARERVVGRFSLSDMVTKYVSLYDQLEKRIAAGRVPAAIQ